MKSNKQSLPDKNGFFGDYGGKFVPETLMYALEQLEGTYNNLKNDDILKNNFIKILQNL